MKKIILTTIAVAFGLTTIKAQLISENFTAYSGQFSAYNSGSPTYVTQTETSNQDPNGAWQSAGSSRAAICTGCSGNRATISASADPASSTSTLYIGEFMSCASTVSVSFDYAYVDRSTSADDELEIALVPESGSEIQLVYVSGSDADASYSNGSVAVIANMKYQFVVRYLNAGYTGTLYGADIDNVIVNGTSGVNADISRVCQTDLSYDVSVDVTYIGNATGNVSDGADVETGITTTGTTASSPFTGYTGTNTFSFYNQADASCKSDTTFTACQPCDLLDVTFGSQTCGASDSFDIDIVINQIASGRTFKITNGTTDFYTSINSTGTYTVSDLVGGHTLYVIDEGDASCSKSESYVPCNICTLPTVPADEPCSAPLVDLSQPYFGSTSCSYTVSSTVNDGCGISQDNDSWLKFIAADDSIALNWEIIGPNSSDCDDGIQIVVFDGSCGSPGTMTDLQCTNPTGGMGSKGTYEVSGLTIGEDYFIYIDGYAGDICDYFWEPITGVAITPPNDTCPEASNVTCGYVDTSSIVLATADDAPGSCGGLTPGKGNWYLYAGNNDSLIISTDNAETNFDTELFVYTGSCGALTCLNSDNDSGSGSTSELRILTSSGTNYYIYVDGNGSSEGTYEISFNCVSAVTCDANAGTWD